MSASTSGFETRTASWQWPSHLPSDDTISHDTDGDDLPQQQNETEDCKSSQPKHAAHQEAQSSEGSNSQPKPQRYWRPRTCRICFDIVLPTSRSPSEHLPSFLQGAPSVVYESPEDGRLLRPCKCKGGSKYVHEGCLEKWRHADRSYGARNFWQCPTCRFQYNIERMTWARWISSAAAQVTLTLLIFTLSVFLLGFVAEPLINVVINSQFFWYSMPRSDYMDDAYLELDPSWTVHFLKGFAALGLLSLFKVLGFMTSMLRIRATGRDRLANLTWLVIMIGALTFLYTVWKGVRAWSRRFLERAGARVMDVQGSDQDDEDDKAF